MKFDSNSNIRELVQQYGEYIYHLAYLYVKNKESAEEIAQDVFYTFSRKHHQFRGNAQLKTYLTRMAINRSHDELRKLKRKAILESVLPFLKNEQSAEARVMKEQEGTTLLSAVLALPIHYREAIILHYYKDYSVIEMTNLLQTSEHTIRTRLRRAKELLKKELGEQMEVALSYE